MSKLSTVITRFETYFAKVLDKFKHHASGSMHVEKGTLNSGGSKIIDLKPLLPKGTTIDQYFIETTLVDLKVIDPDPTSPFKDMAVSSEAVISYGITPNGELTIKNYYGSTVTYWLRVLNPSLKP